MRLPEFNEARRTASAELVTALGFSPNDVLDSRGDGSLWFDGTCVVLQVIEWERRGVPRRDGDRIVTRTERVEITPERLAEYRRVVAGA